MLVESTITAIFTILFAIKIVANNRSLLFFNSKIRASLGSSLDSNVSTSLGSKEKNATSDADTNAELSNRTISNKKEISKEKYVLLAYKYSIKECIESMMSNFFYQFSVTKKACEAVNIQAKIQTFEEKYRNQNKKIVFLRQLFFVIAYVC